MLIICQQSYCVFFSKENDFDELFLEYGIVKIILGLAVTEFIIFVYRLRIKTFSLLAN